MISKEKKFIFIHNYKTGGTSIEKKLGHFDALTADVQDHRTLREIEAITMRGLQGRKCLYALKKGKPGRAWHHLNNALFPEITRRQFDSYYKFTFVRNTWARMYSWYRNIMKDDRMRSMYGIDDVNFNYLDFLKEKVDHRTFSQLYFIQDRKGNVGVDFIGRFEQLQEDFNKVCEHLGISDSELPKMLVRNYEHYTSGYSDKTKDFIYAHYKEEIDYFGFEFGE